MGEIKGIQEVLAQFLEREQRQRDAAFVKNMGGTDFFVDTSNEWMYQISNPANFIPFAELEHDARSFRMIYDPQSRNIFKGDEDAMTLRNDLVYVLLKELSWSPSFGYQWNKEIDQNKKIRQ